MVRVIIPLFCFAAIGFFSGCQWTPDRDNPNDPGSPDYNPNEAIRSLSITTHCQLDTVLKTDICYLTIFAEVYDPDGVSSLDRAWASLDSMPLGQMKYDGGDGTRGYFALSIYAGSDTLAEPMPWYQTKYFVVRFQDDAGDFVEDSTHMSRVICSSGGAALEGCPEWKWHTGDSIRADTSHPLLEWRKFSGVFDFTYRINCYELTAQEQLVWDIRRISPEDSAIRVAPALDNNAQYCCILTVVDEVGNTGSSPCERFSVEY
jgi:hypothetical protein